jgi:N-acetylglucosamine-6-phosphate deacetylase
MNQLLVYNAQLTLENGIEPGAVFIRDGIIAELFKGEELPTGLASEERIDLGGKILAPGMIDIHIHGSAGVDVQNTDEEGLSKLSEFLLREGVTGYFATFVPTDNAGYSRAIETVCRYIEQQDSANSGDKLRRGARIIGIHFEGPFVSQHRCGALQTQHFRTYDGDPHSVELFTSPPCPRLMTIAPETEGGIELIRDITQKGARAFIGHTQADLKTLDDAVEAGAHHITHFPNALDPLHHRKPGAVGWGLVHKEVSMDCIADFHHVHPMMLQLMYQSKGSDRLALISDAIMPAGLGDGEYTVWGDHIAVKDGRTALTQGPAQGAIAGSVITMRDALRNIVSTGVPFHEAVKMSSLAPASATGIDHLYGSIEKGKRADLIVIGQGLLIEFAFTEGRAI